MPVLHLYPGVYVEELPSGVRTITGVSTSLTAFVGPTRRGPINKAVRITSYADYERRFGGLDPASEVSYAVRQFYANGGSDAIVIRTARGEAAKTTLAMVESNTGVLKLKAIDAGAAGNHIEVAVDYDTDNPGSTFNLMLSSIDPDDPAGSIVETFPNLSMNSRDRRYVVATVNDSSKLITVERLALPAAVTFGNGTSTTGALPATVSALLDADHNQFQLSVDGEPARTVTLAGPFTYADMTKLRGDVRTGLLAAGLGTNRVTADVTTDEKSLVFTSQAASELSSVRALPSLQKDASARLKLGPASGGREEDAARAIRPAEVPARSTLTGGTLVPTDVAALPDANHCKLSVSIDGSRPLVIPLLDTTAVGTGQPLTDIAARIQRAVRAANAVSAGWRGFTCTATPVSNTLVLSSGTRGSGSAVAIAAASDADLTSALKLTGLTSTRPPDVTLQDGAEAEWSDSDAYSLLVGSPSERKGIYALESVDLFNLLCLPGVSDAGILADAAAYCRNRRAFLIVDAPRTKTTPDQMVATVLGADLPKTDRAAVYYPWIKVADPLNNGKPRTSPPSGTIAGLYARTDSNRGVWKAPAGTDGPLVGVQGVEYALTDAENGLLNPHAVNCIRAFPVYGVVSWGARTLDGDDQKGSEWKYVPVRRTALYIEESLYRGLKWVVFEPNDEPLWGQIRLNVGAFMHGLFRQSAFQGTAPRDAYFVKCDRETTTQADINLGVVNILVGFAPLKPAEFVIVKIQQMAGQIQT